MRLRIGACGSRSGCRNASGSGPGGRESPTASRIRKSSAVSGSGIGGSGSSSKSSGSRKRARSACSASGIEPTPWPRVSVISAAFQSPPRARQKTRAGSVGESDGFCRSAAQGSVDCSSSRPTSNQRRKSSGVSGPARSISAPRLLERPDAEKPVDPRDQHRIPRAGARRRVGLGEKQAVEERPRLGHALVGMGEDELAHLRRAARAPERAGKSGCARAAAGPRHRGGCRRAASR